MNNDELKLLKSINNHLDNIEHNQGVLNNNLVHMDKNLVVMGHELNYINDNIKTTF